MVYPLPWPPILLSPIQVMQLDPEALADTLRHLPHEEFFGLSPVYTACLHEDIALKDAAAQLQRLLLEQQQQEQEQQQGQPQQQPAPAATQGHAMNVPPYLQQAPVSTPHTSAQSQRSSIGAAAAAGAQSSLPPAPLAPAPAPAAAAGAGAPQQYPLPALAASSANAKSLPGGNHSVITDAAAGSSLVVPAAAPATSVSTSATAAAPAAAAVEEDDDDDLLDVLLGQCIGKPGPAPAATIGSSGRGPTNLQGSAPLEVAGIGATGLAGKAGYPAPAAAAAGKDLAGKISAGGQVGGVGAGLAARQPAQEAAAAGTAVGVCASPSTGEDALSLEDELDALLGLGGKSKVRLSGSTHHVRERDQ